MRIQVGEMTSIGVEELVDFSSLVSDVRKSGVHVIDDQDDFNGTFTGGTARKELMGTGVLFSRTVKSCCWRPVMGEPDFGVTTTSRLTMSVAGWDGGVDC